MSYLFDQQLDTFTRLYQVKGEMAVIENNQIRMEKEFHEPVKEVQERTDREIQEVLDAHHMDNQNDDEWDDHFQNGGGHDEF